MEVWFDLVVGSGEAGLGGLAVSDGGAIEESCGLAGLYGGVI